MKFSNWTLQDLIKYLNSLPNAGPSYFDYTKKRFMFLVKFIVETNTIKSIIKTLIKVIILLIILNGLTEN